MNYWSVVVRQGKREMYSAADAGSGVGQYAEKEQSNEMRRLNCDLTQRQAESIAAFLNDGFLRIDYATAERTV